MKKSYKNLAMTLALGMLAFGIMATPVCAEEEAPSADLSVSLLSKYVWRGYELSDDSIVIQPSMTVGYKGFAANFWGNMDTDQHKDYYTEGDTANWNETDFTLSYDGSIGMVDYGVGYIYYALEDGLEDTQEIYVSAALQTLLTPTLTIYRDIDAGPSTYITLDISHSLPLTETLTLDLGAQVSYYDYDNAGDGYLDPDDVKKGDPSPDTYSALHTGLLSASMTFPMGEYFTITPEIYYSFPLSSDADDFLEMANDYDSDAKIDGDTDFIYGGVTVGMSF